MLTIAIYLFTLMMLLLLFLPHLLCFLIKYSTNIQLITIKTYTPLHYKSLLIKLPIKNKIWGIEQFILYVPDITIKFSLKGFKVIVEISNLEAFMLHNNCKLHQVKVIEGLMEPNLVANLVQFILKETVTGKNNGKNTAKDFVKKYGKFVHKSLSESRQRKQRTQRPKEQNEKGKILTLIQGSFHFLVMMVFQFLEIQLKQNTVNFVSSIPEPPLPQNDQQHQANAKQQPQSSSPYPTHNPSHFSSYLNFTSPFQIKRSLLALRNLCQQTLKIPLLTVRIVVINHFQEEVQLVCPQFSVVNWSHPQTRMLEGVEFFLGIKVPFTLQIGESLKSLQFAIKVKELNFCTVPKDYQMVMQIIKAFNFSLQKLQHLLVSDVVQQSTKAPQPQKPQSFSQSIQPTTRAPTKVNLILEHLYQLHIDQKQAHEYLSNIRHAHFQLQMISFKQQEFRIHSSTLHLRKFRNIHGDLMDDGQVEEGRKDVLCGRPMLAVTGLLFEFMQKETRVSHNPTELFCGREELALLGKLFLLINDRMRFDQLDCYVYSNLFAKVVQFQQKIHNENSKLLNGQHSSHSINGSSHSIIQRITSPQPPTLDMVQFFTHLCFIEPHPYRQQPFLTQQSQPSSTQPQSQEQLTISPTRTHNSFTYEPSSLTFRLIIQNLEHILYLPNSSYKQLIRQEQFQHILSVPQLDLNYNQTKQFGIKDLKMIFRQVPTLNQFALFIESIQMSQNQQTLIEYLNGWIIIKKLLQINKGEEINEDQNQNITNIANKKLSKKNITIRKLQLEYQHQKISIKKFQLQKTTLPNDKTAKLYFSLDRLQFNTKLIKNTGYNLKKVPVKKHPLKLVTQSLELQRQRLRKLSGNILNSKAEDRQQQNSSKSAKQAKNYVEVVHKLFSFDSLTISVKLHNFAKSLNNRKSFTIEKEKTQIHLKNPQLVLPHFDISQKMYKVFKSYLSLQPHINAYIKDKTEDEFIKIKRNLKDFIIEPDLYHLKITNFTILVEQQPLNTHLENFNRFIRQFLSKNSYSNLQNLSQIQVISYLTKNKKESKLCKMTVKEIQCEVKPVDTLANTYKDSVEDWIQGFRKGMEYTQADKGVKNIKATQNRQIRLRKVEAAEFRFAIKNVQFSIRDYPQSILALNQLNFNLTCLKTSNIFNLKNYFFSGQFHFGTLQVNIGLNMLSGLLQIRKKLLSYVQIFNKFEKTTQFTSNIKKTSLRQKLMQQKKMQLAYQPWWYILLNFSEWKFMVKKQPTKINLFTGITPYEKECFEIVLGSFECKSQLQRTELKISELQIKLLQSKILQLRNITTSLSLVQQQNKTFKLYSSILAPNTGKVIVSKKTAFYISTIRQLRSDWLIIYGLQKQNSYDDEQMLHKKQKMNYFELINLTANRMIQKDQENVGFLTMLKQIQVKVQILEFNLVLTNENIWIVLGLQDFEFAHVVMAVKKVRNQWHTLRSNLSIEKMWGSLQKQMEQTTIQRLTQHLKQNEDNIFLAARNFTLNFNKFKLLKDSQPQQIVFLRKFLCLQSIKFAMSLKIKKSIQKLVTAFSPEKLKKQFEEKNKRFRNFNSDQNLTPVERFKAIVWKVIRVNKLKRRKLFGIKHYVMWAQVKRVEFVLLSRSSSVIVDSKHPVILNVIKQYREQDKSYLNPITKLYLRLLDVQINLIEHCQSNIITLLTNHSQKQTSEKNNLIKLSNSKTIQLLLDLESQNQCESRGHSTGHLIMSKGSIQVDHKSKSILTQLIEFIVQLTNDKEKKWNEYKKAHEKFNELQNNGRQLLKAKIIQKYNEKLHQDTEKLMFKWKFEINYTKISLITPMEQKLKFSSNTVSFIRISRPFILVDSQMISCQLNFYSNEKVEKTFQVNDLVVLNLLQKEDSIFRKIVSMNHNQNLALYAFIESYDVLPLSKIMWQYFSKIKVHINPIKVRVTEQLYAKFYEFLFPEAKLTMPTPSNQSNSMIPSKTQIPNNYQQNFIPDYINFIEIQNLKVQVWFQTKSMIKRMQGITVGLEGYKVQKAFATKKQLFDDWIKFVLKQMAGQVFSVLGQKIFGSNQTTDQTK